ncbi:MAG: hypothetical protein HW421_1669, partial [Ignavibacteria bacterium]|nr:hypothetical protein [Ignavibacteria bacterium]
MRSSLKLLFALIFTCIIAPPLLADDWYVANSGSNSNSGTFGDPFATIEYAISIANDNDNIYVNGGDSFSANCSVTLSGVTLTNYGTGNAIVNGGGTGTAFTVQAEGVSISNFTIYDYDVAVDFNATNVDLSSVSNCSFSFTSGGSGVIKFSASAIGDIEITGNTFTGSTIPEMYMAGNNVVPYFYNNTISSSTSLRLFTWTGTPNNGSKELLYDWALNNSNTIAAGFAIGVADLTSERVDGTTTASVFNGGYSSTVTTGPIEGAYTDATAGGYVLLTNGNTFSVPCVTQGITLNKNITIQPFSLTGTNPTIMHASGGSGSTFKMFSITAANVTFRNLDIELGSGGTGFDYGVYVTSGNASTQIYNCNFDADDAGNILVDNVGGSSSAFVINNSNFVITPGATAIQVAGSVTGLSFNNNTSYSDTYSSGNSGTFFNLTSSGTITNGDFNNQSIPTSSSAGVHSMYKLYGNLSNVQIRNNSTTDEVNCFLYIGSAASFGSDFTIHSNVLKDTVSKLNNANSTTVDARYNYWGSCNNAWIASKFTGNVNFRPYYYDEAKTTLYNIAAPGQARSIVFSAVTDGSISLRWTNPTCTGALIAYYPTGATTWAGGSPSDGSTYEVGNTLSSSTVGAIVTYPTNVATISGLVAGKTYLIKVFPYNTQTDPTCGTYTAYNTTGGSYNPRGTSTRPSALLTIADPNGGGTYGTEATICFDETARLKVSITSDNAYGGSARATYRDGTGATTTQSAIGASSNTYSVGPSLSVGSHNYNLVSAYDNSARSCVLYSTAALLIKPIPSATVTADSYYCGTFTSVVDFDFAGTAPFSLTYSDNGSPQVITSDYSSTFIDVSGSTSHTYTILKVSDYYGCTNSSVSSSDVLTWGAFPSITGIDDTNGQCEPAAIGSATTSDANAIIKWYDSEYYGSTVTVPTQPSGTVGSVWAWAEASNTISGCLSGYRVLVTATVDPLPTCSASITGGEGYSPTSKTFCVGDVVDLEAITDESIYSWSGPSAFTSTSQSPTFTAAVINEGTYKLYVTDEHGCNSSTFMVDVWINPPITYTSGPSSATICENTSHSFTVNATNVGQYSWYYSADNGSNWTPWGAYSNVLENIFNVNYNGYKFTCLMTPLDGCSADVWSSTVTLTVNPDIVFSYGPNQNPTAICELVESIELDVVASNVNTYQWRVSTNGTTWNNLTNSGYYTGVTTASLTITNPSATIDNYQYMCHMTPLAGCSATVNSSLATVSVDPTSVGGNITPTTLSDKCDTEVLPTLTLNGYTGAITWHQYKDGGPY